MHFCGNCGGQVDDSANVCPSCGAQQANQTQTQQQYQQQQYQQQQSYQQYQQPYQQYRQAPTGGMPFFNGSDWDGGVLDTIVNSIIASLIVTFTCGIATPWAVCYTMKFVIEHTLIDGRRLQFTGTGGDLFAQWVKWWLLTLVTCGIYSFWVTPRLYKWICNHIHTL